MDKIENASCNEVQDDVIVLGTASVETQGAFVGSNEPIGAKLPPGISEE